MAAQKDGMPHGLERGDHDTKNEGNPHAHDRNGQSGHYTDRGR